MKKVLPFALILSVLLFACNFSDSDTEITETDIGETAPAVQENDFFNALSNSIRNETEETEIYETITETTIITTSKEESTTQTTKETAKISATVWIPQSGSKYHINSGCSNMKNPTQVSKDDAINMGYTPCKRCY